MGKNDYNALCKEYWDDTTGKSEYTYATHWLIALCYYNQFPRIITVPCASDGSSPSISPVRITLLGDQFQTPLNFALDLLKKQINEILNDVFWSGEKLL
ncbi:hypothetical protein QFZ81_001012 [Paenibacillus sp. V4I9]|uniref:hypothetical protein n=1 Tax=Paenibacillus sp. V4I9 TaxID=3042308 RepID=UPI002789CEDD|nr:hypothetical protein [Paenibacillus sp. V4I9]MDQ0885924.1 hypothetical protein [Paenibacillus sp. V4I9]